MRRLPCVPPNRYSLCMPFGALKADTEAAASASRT
jgi:hypothetical protein